MSTVQAMEEGVVRALSEKEDALDEEIKRLERLDEDELEALRARRITQLRKKASERCEMVSRGHGSYTEVQEKEFFEAAKRSSKMVVHFYRSATWRCQVLDKHLSALAVRHLETRFVKIDAEKAQFLAERLKIWMLPTLVLVRDGKTEHSIVGFDELGGHDNFSAEDLECLLHRWRITDNCRTTTPTQDHQDDEHDD
ncbi:unnamed protein product [Vitrella brassicaformis CCMP3155]|uniref:Thioredoxin domain-containing protein n=2 Tax=Vitrella brassicaformis TaxID=1169539 RepID=A0A0G4GT36_VITBC|nr:unnamed protein product [Vitrella brassicaformis CCMP3155]|eukprot:CEM33856.1 unnamed protein product [Vitrella brassicaformis CCMP3155]